MWHHRLRLLATGVAVASGATLLAAPGALAGNQEPTEPRTITIKAVEPRDDVFFVKGRMDPAWAGRHAVLQRKLRKATHWHRWRSIETSAESRYRHRVSQLGRPGVVCYRVRVRETQNYLESFSDRVCIRTYWE